MRGGCSVLREQIYKVLDMATLSERSAGLELYFRAHDYAASLAREFGFTVEQTSSVIAVLSPNTTWSQNWVDSKRICWAFRNGQPCRTSSWPVNNEKANKILANSENPRQYVVGIKVAAFQDNIYRPSISNAVCVDFHMYSLVHGAPMRMLDVPHISKTVNGQIQDAFRQVAGELRWMPHQLQSVVWLTWRRLAGGTPNSQLELWT